MESPHLKALHEKYADRGLRILAVNASEPARDPRATIEKYVKDNALPYTVLIGGRTVFKTDYEGQSIPTTYLIDRKGRIAFSHIGWDDSTRDTMEAHIKKLLNE